MHNTDSAYYSGRVARPLTVSSPRFELLPEIPHGAVSRDSVVAAKWRLKRAIDIAGASMLLVLLSPVFLVAAMLVKLTSRGPALFKQERLGLNRRPFVMLKFRTMVVGAEQEEVAFRESNRGTFFKVRNDPRVTRVGSFLRRSSLDELPQFVNILRGEMSLVGPRPLAELELLHFRPWIDLRRFSMKPGLTCIWQVNGRSHTSDEDRMRYDLQYIDQWSLGLDIKLMWKTIPAVLKGDGAV